MDFDWDIGQIIKDIAPDILSGAGGLIDSFTRQGENRDASRNYASGAQASADILKQGYDDQLTHLEGGADYLRDVYGAGLTDTSNILTGAADEYGGALEGAAEGYGGYMIPQVDQYGNVVMAAADDFAEDYSPYLESGQNAQDYQASVMGTDPSQWTPSQQRLIDEYKRDSLARLAASGLRGAGRAGVAAVNEGDAALRARLYDQNIARADAAANTLGARGYSATGTVAGNRQAATRNVADTRLGVARDIGGKIYDAGVTGAQAKFNTGGQVAGLTGQYYSNIANTEGGRFQSRGDTAFGKAIADSSARGNITENKAATDFTNSNLRGEAIGQIANVIAGRIKTTMPKPGDTISGGSSQDTLTG